MSFTTVLHILGRGLALFAAAMAVPSLIALAYGEGAEALAFLTSSVLTVFVGGGLALATSGGDKRLARREGFLLVTLGWAVLPLFGALPLVFSGTVESFGYAYFEALSGLSTTGATILENVEATARSVLFWRAEMQWLGGLATVMLAMTILSHMGIPGTSLYHSAMPRGPGDGMMPRLAFSVRSVWWIYALLTLLCAVALVAVGMPAFDAVSHALSTLSGGGFSTRTESIGAFENPAAEWVLVPFMIAGALNFTLHWALFQGRARAYLDDPEFRYLLIIAGIAIVLVILSLMAIPVTWSQAIRYGVFTTVSMLTTTGFDNSFGVVTTVPIIVIVFLTVLFIGGSTTSTAGGIKQMRLLLLLRQSGRELGRLAHPHGVVRLRYGKRVVPEPAMRGVWCYFMAFLLVLAATILVVAGSGVEFDKAIFASMAAITNAGPAYDMLAAGQGGYRSLPDIAKGALAFAMIMGRVEMFSLLTLLNPVFWRR